MNQGETLKKILKEKGITQLQIAEKLDVNRTYITNQLKLQKLPKKLIEQVADLLEMDFEKLDKALNIEPGKSGYVELLEKQLSDKEHIIKLLEDKVALYEKLERERTKKIE